MLFAGRRLGAEGIAVLASMRSEAHRADANPWLERLPLGPLEQADARTLLQQVQGDRLAAPVAERLIAGAAGNPLALLEIPTLLSDAQLAGREPLESPLQPGTGIKRAFRRRVDQLPEDARRAVLVAAASEGSRVDTIVGGLRAIGLDAAALEPAEAADLVRIADGRLDIARGRADGADAVIETDVPGLLAAVLWHGESPDLLSLHGSRQAFDRFARLFP
jgi:hypothetical protein